MLTAVCKEIPPLNLVFIGEMDEIFSALFGRQWNMTQEADLSSSWKEMKAFLFGTSFRYAPASSLYFMDGGKM
jgi:hypothetical protein